MRTLTTAGSHADWPTKTAAMLKDNSRQRDQAAKKKNPEAKTSGFFYSLSEPQSLVISHSSFASTFDFKTFDFKTFDF